MGAASPVSWAMRELLSTQGRYVFLLQPCVRPGKGLRVWLCSLCCPPRSRYISGELRSVEHALAVHTSIHTFAVASRGALSGLLAGVCCAAMVGV